MDVIEGYCAVAVDGGWIGVAARNRYCEHTRKTSEEALEDARRLGT